MESYLLQHRSDFIEIDDFASYKRCRVQLHAQGIVERDAVQGAELKTKKQQVCRTNEFLVAEIDAKLGGFGIVPESLDGTIVSSHYFLFTIDESALDHRFLNFYIRTPAFMEQVRAKGTTNYAAIRPKDVLQYEIPLPLPEEQRRIVTRIEELGGRIEEARVLRQEAEKEVETLSVNISQRFFSLDGSNTKFAQLEAMTSRITKGESPEWQGFSYQEFGPTFVRSENVLWGSLDLSNRIHIPLEFHQKLRRSQLHPNNVLINLVGASIGRACVVPDDIGEANVNQAVAVISPIPERLDSRYLVYFLLSRYTQSILHSGKVETARPNISLADLRTLTLPDIPLSEQIYVVKCLDDLQAKIGALKLVQTGSGKELNALLPSILDKAFKGEL